ncbi:efflux RND transporter permease subunit [Nitratifractor sp.]
MFERSLRFFLRHSRFNHTLLLLLTALGIYAYLHLPKELTPVIEPDSVTVRGSYRGASIDTLNTMVVGELEAEIRTIGGIASLSSVVSSGRFSIVAELEKGIDKNRIVQAIEDAVAAIRPDLPSDMDDPLIRSVAHSRSLMHVAVLSKTLSRDRLLEIAQKLRKRILKIPYVSDVTIFGDSQAYYEIGIDPAKLEAYGLDIEKVRQALSELSYLYPLGEIDGPQARFYLSIRQTKLSAQEISHTLLHLGDRTITLGDIATVQRRLDTTRTLASMNGKDAVTLAVSQNPRGDALLLAKEVKRLLRQSKIPGVQLEVRRDQSRIVRDRLGIVVSNILFALLLIVGLISLLVNGRIAFVIALGIPTSFIMGAIFFYLAGYSININSLIGVLIALGIIVDDAIVVSENIQQYIQRGYPPKEAALLGTKEMLSPVTIASLTTLFSFIPLLMIDGRLGEIIRLIPIALSALVLASLIESFLFLPVHASHLLRADAPVKSWERAQKTYQHALRYLSRYKKILIALFWISTPILIAFWLSHMRFQIFQRFDADSVEITFKAAPQTSLETSLRIVQTLERDLLKEKDRFAIKQISSTAGYRRNATGTTEIYPYVGQLSVELEKRKSENIFERYIAPLLNPYSDETPGTRTQSSQQISRALRRWIKKRHYKERFGLESLTVTERRMGHTKADIRIGVISEEYPKALQAVKRLETLLASMPGIKNYGDDIKFGIDEIKIEVNDYGKRLGVTKRFIGEYLSRFYLPKKIGQVTTGKRLMDIKLASIKRGDLAAFKNLRIRLKTGAYVRLDEICTIRKTRSLERLVKDEGETTFYLFANLDPDRVSDTEILHRLQPLMRTLEKEGIRFRLRGEAQQKRTLKGEMILASILAIVLIFGAIMYLFDSITQTLLVMSVIPLSFLGVLAGHSLMGLNLSLPSLIGALGLAGVIVNDGIIMINTLREAQHPEAIYPLAARRLRPIVLTTITTLAGLSSLIFFAGKEAAVFQPIAVSLGFGLLWGTILNLFYLPIFYLLIVQRDALLSRIDRSTKPITQRDAHPPRQ